MLGIHSSAQDGSYSAQQLACGSEWPMRRLLISRLLLLHQIGLPGAELEHHPGRTEHVGHLPRVEVHLAQADTSAAFGLVVPNRESFTEIGSATAA